MGDHSNWRPTTSLTPAVYTSSMQIDILTLFPDMFRGPFSESILKRAQERNLVTINLHNFRDYAQDRHKSVDDTPYGGGLGMVLRVDVLVAALEAILDKSLPSKTNNEKIFLMSAKGETFTQNHANKLAQLDRLVLIAGHYEGVDERLLKFIDGEISIGNFVLTGGELPAMTIVDAVVRLLPGVITEGSAVDESFSDGSTTEYPQYTRPEEYRDYKVPEVLLSGNHQAIAKWRNQQKGKRSLSEE